MCTYTACFYLVYGCLCNSLIITDMMPALHNYITVDTPAFLSKPDHIQIIYNMCKQVGTGAVESKTLRLIDAWLKKNRESCRK